MKNFFPKDFLKVVLNTADEISSSGETIHQTYGELSISLERLLTKTTRVTNGVDGSKMTETKEWLTEDEKQKTLVEDYHKKASGLLKEVYDNQRHTKQLVFNIALLIFIAIVLIFFIRPLIGNLQIIYTLANERLSSIISIIVAISILVANYFQWWSIEYNGGMRMKTWVKYLFVFCIILLVAAFFLVLR